MFEHKRMDPQQSNATKVEECSIRIIPLKVIRLFAIVILLIAVLGTFCNYLIYHVVTPGSDIAKVLKRFDLGHEPSIPSFYSAIAILVGAALLFLIGKLSRQKTGETALQWHLLGILFVCLSVDEAVQFHEMLDTAMSKIMGKSGLFFLPWTIAGAAFSIVVAIFFLPFLLRLPVKTRNLMILAGAIFVAGAIGMEMVASLIFSDAGSIELGVQRLSHTFSQFLEELLEMAGIVLFIFALLDYLRSNFKTLIVHF